MLGATLFYELMSPVPKPVGESIERLHITGNPAAMSVILPAQVAQIPASQDVRQHVQGYAPFPRLGVGGIPDPPAKQFFNPSPAVDLVYGMWVVPKPVVTEQVYPPSAIGFPNQFSWLRMYDNGAVQTLCVVATADAPLGNQLRIQNAGLSYAIYLVDTTDPNASAARVKTSTGIKAIRLKT